MFNPEDFIETSNFSTIRGNIRIEIALVTPLDLNTIRNVQFIF
jgi:hypothetical protein